MIESCTKKRMILAITILGGLTFIVLIVESQWTERASYKPYVDNFEPNITCIINDGYEIISECHPCTAFEIASRSIGICTHARYKEILRCKNGDVITRSCDKVAWLEEQTFLKFEGFMFSLSVSSCIIVFWREKILRRRINRKIARQLRCTV